eukprot:scaffold92027_cov26-Tisochrysis_lutea.AAC.7
MKRAMTVGRSIQAEVDWRTAESEAAGAPACTKEAGRANGKPCKLRLSGASPDNTKGAPSAKESSEALAFVNGTEADKKRTEVIGVGAPRAPAAGAIFGWTWRSKLSAAHSPMDA